MLSIFTKKVVFAQKDTLPILHEKIILKYIDTTDNEKINITNKFYDDIKQTSQRHGFMFWVYQNIFRYPKMTMNTANGHPEDVINIYKKYNGMPVSNIIIHNMSPFGYSVTDTLKTPTLLLDKVGNATHIKSWKTVIKNHLILSEGDTFDAAQLLVAERILREANYLYDVRIYPALSSDSASVNVLVYTQDVFPWGLGIDLGIVPQRSLILDYLPDEKTVNKYTINNINAIGLGHQLSNSMLTSVSRYWGHNATYKIPYLGKSFITADISYVNQANMLKYQASFTRNFISPTTKYAGGLVYNRTFPRRILGVSDYETLPYDFHYTDAWFSRALKLYSGVNNKGTRLIISARNFNYIFDKTLPISADSNKVLQNTHTFMVGLGYSKRYYMRDMLIFGFGKTEDVPIGYAIAINQGVEYTLYGLRYYAGINASQAMFMHGIGYFYASLGAGTYMSSVMPEQGVINGTFNFFTRLYSIYTFKMRHFLHGSIVFGQRRKNIEALYINENDGIQGFFDTQVRGSQKITLNYQTVLFSPLELLGFKTTFFIFADLAWVNNSLSAYYTSQFYQAFGAGFRFKNERLTISAFQLRFGYYPQLNNVDKLAVDFGGIQFLRLRDFDINYPDVVMFR
ncbi:MAG: hypothetical protein NW207_04510 [Cytophagales bacterium]|nr:hypothetical protein [Cytophagales bacterium]